MYACFSNTPFHTRTKYASGTCNHGCVVLVVALPSTVPGKTSLHAMTIGTSTSWVTIKVRPPRTIGIAPRHYPTWYRTQPSHARQGKSATQATEAAARQRKLGQPRQAQQQCYHAPPARPRYSHHTHDKASQQPKRPRQPHGNAS